MDLEAVVDRLIELPGVIAVVLGGSRAARRHRPDSDWDLGLYYRQSLDSNHVRALGFEGNRRGSR